VTRNRWGAADSELVLTEKSATWRSDPDDSSVTLNLQYNNKWPPEYLNQAVMERLGFDCSVAVDDKKAYRHYAQQRAKRAFLAVRFGADAKLEAFDVALTREEVRAKYRDRNAVFIVPAVVGVRHMPVYEQAQPAKQLQYRIAGYASEYPSRIHVPLPYAEQLRTIGSSYKVRVRFGELLEPEIISVSR
jgi:hypothetical protein